jgi:peptidoglycan L-alanyl-D-glutamate endopeptidase CwlK
MASRSLDDLTPTLKEKWMRVACKAADRGIRTLVTCTARDLKEQTALYAQGRNELLLVNELRKIAKLPPIDGLTNSRKVTWTMKSKHICKSGEKSKAIDFAVFYEGKASWDIKVNCNDNDIPDYYEVGQIAKEEGLKWGGDFSSPDFPHLEEF